MNIVFVIAGALALFATIGHVLIGGKSFLAPMLAAGFDEVPKKVMHCLFHFITVDFALSTLVFLGAGLGLTLGFDPRLVLLLSAARFALYCSCRIYRRFCRIIIDCFEGGKLRFFGAACRRRNLYYIVLF